jgi:hypothetical protein
MAKVKPIKPVARVVYEPVMLALRKARAMGWVLQQLGDGAHSQIGNNLTNAPGDALHPGDTHDGLAPRDSR